MLTDNDFHFDIPINKCKILESLDLIYNLEIEYDIKILTKEAYMLRLVKRDPDKYLKHYLIKSGLSVRWFGIIVRSLVDRGLIKKTRCDKDIRGRTLS